MNNVIDNEVIKLKKKTRQINEKQEKTKKNILRIHGCKAKDGNVLRAIKYEQHSEKDAIKVILCNCQEE